MQNMPIIIDNFISKDDNSFILNMLKTIEKETPNPNIRGALGIENTYLASKINLENPIIPLSNNEDINKLSMLLTKIMLDIKKIIADYFNAEISLKQFNYVNMLPKSSNGLHFDSHNDGEHEREYAALLYLNNEYSGGFLNFPDIELKLFPNPRTLIFLKGDQTLMHEVTEITSGERKNLVMFFGNANTVSDPSDKFLTYENTYGKEF